MRLTGSVAILLLAVFAGWRVLGQMQAERYADAAPERALDWRPADPVALLTLAERRLAAGDLVPAQDAARKLLANEPLQGKAFRVLAEAADRQGNRKKAFELYRIAERRAPRDLQTRAWLTQRYLEQGDYGAALAQMDRILRMAPQYARNLHPVLIKLSADPRFAKSLAAALHSGPPWRAGVLAALQAPKTGDPAAAGLVMQALQEQGGLTEQEYARWLDSLLAAGRWGEAYARWAGQAAKSGGKLPLIYNGDFARAVSSSGFDWRRRRVPGVLLQFERVAGTQGPAAYLHFLGRRVPNAGLEQPLLLSPGAYRLAFRARALGLRSALGLQWVIACAGSAGIVARSAPIDGSFGWRQDRMEFQIPSDGCPGQWLRLVNPVAGGAAQQVAGELWLDDVALMPQG